MTIQHKRRTFKEVAEQGYAKGWEQGYAKGWEQGYAKGWEQGYAKGGSEGREAARVEFEAAYNLLCKHTNAMELEASQLRERLDNMSPGRLLWSRLTGLFKGMRYD